MWLHILKKDLKLHWPYVAAVLALKVVAVWMILEIGFAWRPQLILLRALTELAVSVVTAFVIIVVVQSDPVVSNHDDWLIRPIRRIDLALEKICFAALVTILPAFVFDLVVGVVHGLNVSTAIGAAAYLAIFRFIDIGLPALAIGAITASWAQAAGIAFTTFLTWVAVSIMTRGEMADLDSWPVQLMILIIFVVAGALILGLQYGRRSTATSRGIFVVATLCAMAVIFIPGIVGYLIQPVMVNSKVATIGPISPIRLTFDDQPKVKAYGMSPQLTGTAIYVPLKVSVDPNRIVTIDRIVVNIASLDGKPLYRGMVSIMPGHRLHRTNNLLGNTFDGASNDRMSNYQAVDLPDEVIEKFRNTPGRLSLTYLLTSYAPTATVKATLPFGTPQKIAGLGVCATRLNPGDDKVVDLNCFPTTDSPKCIAATALNSAGTSIGTPQTDCSITSPQWGINTRALTDAGQPVISLPAEDSAEIQSLALTSYKMAKRFRLTVILPPMRLADLMVSPGA
jgi:hypothetical protein